MAGILLPGTNARIVRKEVNEADFGRVRGHFPGGPNVIMESLNNKTGDPEIFTPDGWLRGGDGFIADEQGRFL
jgi:long-subunit acyl-CoA synthetase (AMP-forming)